jgi:hypothetical protein
MIILMNINLNIKKKYFNHLTASILALLLISATGCSSQENPEAARIQIAQKQRPRITKNTAHSRLPSKTTQIPADPQDYQMLPYNSTTPQFPAHFEYPSYFKVDEYFPRSHDFFVISLNHNPAPRYVPAVKIRITYYTEPGKKERYTLEHFYGVDRKYISKKKDVQILAETQIPLWNLIGKKIVFTYQEIYPPHLASAKYITYQSVLIYASYKEQLYKIEYIVAAEKFDQYKPFFDHFLATFIFYHKTY